MKVDELIDEILDMMENAGVSWSAQIDDKTLRERMRAIFVREGLAGFWASKFEKFIDTKLRYNDEGFGLMRDACDLAVKRTVQSMIFSPCSSCGSEGGWNWVGDVVSCRNCGAVILDRRDREDENRDSS